MVYLDMYVLALSPGHVKEQNLSRSFTRPGEEASMFCDYHNIMHVYKILSSSNFFGCENLMMLCKPNVGTPKSGHSEMEQHDIEDSFCHPKYYISTPEIKTPR